MNSAIGRLIDNENKYQFWSWSDNFIDNDWERHRLSAPCLCSHTAVTLMYTVLITWSTQSPVILKALCGSSSLSIFTTFGFISARRVRSSHTVSVNIVCVSACVCFADCSSWTVTVRAAPSRCVSCWPNRTSWCRRETHSPRRCRTYTSRYTHKHTPPRKPVRDSLLCYCVVSLQVHVIVISFLK